MVLVCDCQVSRPLAKSTSRQLLRRRLFRTYDSIEISLDSCLRSSAQGALTQGEETYHPLSLLPSCQTTRPPHPSRCPPVPQTTHRPLWTQIYDHRSILFFYATVTFPSTLPPFAKLHHNIPLTMLPKNTRCSPSRSELTLYELAYYHSVACSISSTLW